MSFFSHNTVILVREIHPACLFHPARLLDTQEYFTEIFQENTEYSTSYDSRLTIKMGLPFLSHIRNSKIYNKLYSKAQNHSVTTDVMASIFNEMRVSL